jgi:hypothetical protein
MSQTVKLRVPSCSLRASCRDTHAACRHLGAISSIPSPPSRSTLPLSEEQTALFQGFSRHLDCGDRVEQSLRSLSSRNVIRMEGKYRRVQYDSHTPSNDSECWHNPAGRHTCYRSAEVCERHQRVRTSHRERVSATLRSDSLCRLYTEGSARPPTGVAGVPLRIRTWR